MLGRVLPCTNANGPSVLYFRNRLALSASTLYIYTLWDSRRIGDVIIKGYNIIMHSLTHTQRARILVL